MDTDSVSEASDSDGIVKGGDQVEESTNVELSTSDEMMIGELEKANKVVTEVELHLACISERLVNLSILMMHVATRESDFEALASNKETVSPDSAEKAMEFDLLYGILESEIAEVDKFLGAFHIEIVSAQEIIFSCKHRGSTFVTMEEKLCDCQKSLKQSQEQVSEIRMQSAKLQKILTCQKEDGNHDEGIEESYQFYNSDAELKMHPAEQHQQILRMLEKSLARELDLDKKLAESRNYEEELRLRLVTFEHVVFSMEEEVQDVWKRFFEAENAEVVFMGISKELLGQLQVLQFNLNASMQREAHIRSEDQGSTDGNIVHEVSPKKVKKSDKELNDDLIEQTDSLKYSLRQAEEKLSIANSEASILKEQVSLLEKQSTKSAEANQEKQNMLYSTIRNMENLVQDLESKVSKAEDRAALAEEKCNILSETNVGLTEELTFLRARVGSLEASLHQAEILKMETANDISNRTKIISNLLMQLAIERQRLCKQISSLASENNILVVELRSTKQSSSVFSNQGNVRGCKEPNLEHSSVSSCSVTNCKDKVAEISGTDSEPEKNEKDISGDETELRPLNSVSEHDTIRKKDGLSSWKYIFVIILIVLLIMAIACFMLLQN